MDYYRVGTLVNTHGIRGEVKVCLLYTSPSPRDVEESRMPSSA
ncbi:ribosome maturation factor RimM [Lactobacillus sp.] [Lactiplantibacillus mudanjiangensis]|nr:ribosome maturation factor RimM [Lactobacillus sp.] [Lactiplantibacillus mudanjiangensis]